MKQLFFSRVLQNSAPAVDAVAIFCFSVQIMEVLVEVEGFCLMKCLSNCKLLRLWVLNKTRTT